MNSKRIRWASLTVAAMLAVVTGCSGSGGDKASNTANQGQQATKNQSTAASNSFNLWLGWTATINNDSMVQKNWKEKEPGVAVTLETTQGDAMTALNLKINTGGFEDAAIFGRNETVKSAMNRSKQILSVEQYFDMPDKYPGLAAIPKAYLDKMKDKDGHIWSIPTWFDQNPDDPWPGWASQAWMVRSDVLEKVGMTTADLSTIEGVEAFLKKAAGVKDETGKALIPLSFLMDTNDSLSWNDENTVLTAFGVSTASNGVEKKGDEFVFAYDDPNYKAAYQWMNKMYREKLIDPEVVTSKKEQYNEKNKSGRVALNVGSFWNIPSGAWETLDGPTGPGWYYEAISFPKVNGVDKVGVNQVINPNPGYDVYISKGTKNLDAILKFFDYTLQPKPEQQQVINEGPAGLYWDWVDQPLGKWKFTDETYKKSRNSGDSAQKAKVTPELYMASSYSNKWYPWWNTADGEKAGAAKTIQFTEAIGKMGTIRVAEPYDLVETKQGGVWEKYWPELENIRKEYRAKLLMAKDDARFEKEWNNFREVLEKRGHWTEVKQEWNESYQEQLKANGE
ncbi:type 2 periplasmic-binding domain-containing protein [Paenibacillus sp. BAC0078]